LSEWMGIAHLPLVLEGGGNGTPFALGASGTVRTLEINLRGLGVPSGVAGMGGCAGWGGA